MNSLSRDEKEIQSLYEIPQSRARLLKILSHDLTIHVSTVLIQEVLKVEG